MKDKEKKELFEAIFKNGFEQIIDSRRKEGKPLSSEDCKELAEASSEMLERKFGELSVHSDQDIARGCIRLLNGLCGAFEEYLEWVGFTPETEEERFSYSLYYSTLIRTLFLSNTSHSGGTSTGLKCKQLGFDYSKTLEFSVGEEEVEC